MLESGATPIGSIKQKPPDVLRPVVNTRNYIYAWLREFPVTHHLIPFTFKEKASPKDTSEKLVCYFHRVLLCYVQKPRCDFLEPS